MFRSSFFGPLCSPLPLQSKLWRWRVSNQYLLRVCVSVSVLATLVSSFGNFLTTFQPSNIELPSSNRIQFEYKIAKTKVALKLNSQPLTIREKITNTLNTKENLINYILGILEMKFQNVKLSYHKLSDQYLTSKRTILKFYNDNERRSSLGMGGGVGVGGGGGGAFQLPPPMSVMNATRFDHSLDELQQLNSAGSAGVGAGLPSMPSLPFMSLASQPLMNMQMSQPRLLQHQHTAAAANNNHGSHTHAIQLQTSLEMGPVVCPALCEIRTQLQELTRSVESCQSEVHPLPLNIIFSSIKSVVEIT